MKYSVLVVDDDSEFVASVHQILPGYIIFEADGASQALHLLRRPADIDIILLDLKLPRIPGMQLLKEIKSLRPNIAIIIITAFGTKKSILDALRLNVNDFLEKPVDPATLRASVERIVADLPVPPFENSLVQRLLHFVDTNYNKQITLNSAAQTLHHNPKYLSRIFKESVGFSFSEYKQIVRVDRACQLLTESNLTVDQISYNVGYLNAESFNRIFKKYQHMTPTAYRTPHAESADPSRDMSPAATMLSNAKWIHSLSTFHAHEKEFNLLARQSTEIICLFDQQYKHVYVNNAISRFTGIPRSRYLGKTNEELGYPEHMCALWNQAISTVFSRAVPINSVFDFSSPKGDFKMVACMTPVFNKKGRVSHVFSIVRNITAPTSHIDNRDVVKASLPEPVPSPAAKRKDKLIKLGTNLSAVVHELKTPLASAESIADAALDTAQNQTTINHINDLQNKLNESRNLIANVLNLINGGSDVIPPELVFLEPILDECCVSLLRHFPRKKVHINKHYSCLRTVACLTQPAFIKTALHNVLLNAFQALPKANGVINISTRLTDNDMVVIEVADTGKGIAQKDLANVIKPFYTTRARGTGLGLYISNSIISRHGGTLSVSSTTGKGTTVYICLKLAKSL